jgi:hypothetical protein
MCTNILYGVGQLYVQLIDQHTIRNLMEEFKWQTILGFGKQSTNISAATFLPHLATETSVLKGIKPIKHYEEDNT